MRIKTATNLSVLPPMFIQPPSKASSFPQYTYKSRGSQKPSVTKSGSHQSVAAFCYARLPLNSRHAAHSFSQPAIYYLQTAKLYAENSKKYLSLSGRDPYILLRSIYYLKILFIRLLAPLQFFDATFECESFLRGVIEAKPS